MITVRIDFCGGNAQILSVTDDTVVFAPELRDTEGDWFYWAFAVMGAAGKTVHFQLAHGRWIGYFGAAVSHDLYTWEWSGRADADYTGFTYTFAENEDFVYFAHNMLYHPSRFLRIAERLGMHVTVPVIDRNDTPICCAVLGAGEHNILLTARHHCCEATGNYIMEGILEAYATHPIPNCRITVVPFVDADGVVKGDQGKNRRPHDHNRDYIDAVYPGVRLVQDIMAAGDVIAAFDLHSPWHFGGSNDRLFVVRKSEEMLPEFIRFGQLLEEEMSSDPGAMRYETKNDMDLGVEWNQPGPNNTSATYCGSIPGVRIAFSFETTYFGEEGNVVSQDRLLRSGRCFEHAIARYVHEKGLN